MTVSLKMDWRDLLLRIFVPVFYSSQSIRVCTIFMIIGTAIMGRRRQSWSPWFWLQVALASFRYPYNNKIASKTSEQNHQRLEMESTSFKDTLTTAIFPTTSEYKSVRSWKMESAISSILVTMDGIVYGTRYGLVSLIRFDDKWFPNVDHQIHAAKNTEDLYHVRPNRWWTGNNEILSIAKVSNGILIIDGVKMLLLDPNDGSKPIRGFYGGLTLATTNHYGLFGTLNAVCIVDLVVNPFESMCFNEVFNGGFRVELGEPIHHATIKGNTAVCCGQSNAYVLDLDDPSRGKRIITAADSITCIALCEEMILVMATTNGVCQSWDVINGRPLAAFEKYKGVVYAMDITRDGKQAAIGSSAEYEEDFTIHIWDLHLGTLLYQLSHHTELVSGIAFSERGSFLITASWDGTIHQVDLKHGDRSRFLLFLKRGKKILPEDILLQIFAFLI